MSDAGKIKLPPTRRHGTISGHQAGCKCTPCNAAWSAYQAWWRISRRGRVHSCPTCSCPMPEKPADV